MKFKKISIGACILALVLIAGATTAFAATATNDNGSHISRSDAVLIDVDGNFLVRLIQATYTSFLIVTCKWWMLLMRLIQVMYGSFLIIMV